MYVPLDDGTSNLFGQYGCDCEDYKNDSKRMEVGCARSNYCKWIVQGYLNSYYRGYCSGVRLRKNPDSDPEGPIETKEK